MIAARSSPGFISPHGVKCEMKLSAKRTLKSKDFRAADIILILYFSSVIIDLDSNNGTVEDVDFSSVLHARASTGT